MGERNITAPYGYKGSESFALFNIDPGYVFWLEGIPDGRRWEDAVRFKASTQTLNATFRIAKRKGPGGGKWYDLKWLRS